MKNFPCDAVLCILILRLSYIVGKFSAVLGLNESSVTRKLSSMFIESTFEVCTCRTDILLYVIAAGRYCGSIDEVFKLIMY